MVKIPSRKDCASQLTTRSKGIQYEQQARRYLERAGLTFVAANVTLRGGEIDLIMRDGQILVFVEVRYRRNAVYGDALASVSYHKQQKVINTAARWLMAQGMSFDLSPCRFDILAITGDKWEWITNAFGAN